MDYKMGLSTKNGLKMGLCTKHGLQNETVHCTKNMDCKMGLCPRHGLKNETVCALNLDKKKGLYTVFNDLSLYTFV